MNILYGIRCLILRAEDKAGQKITIKNFVVSKVRMLLCLNITKMVNVHVWGVLGAIALTVNIIKIYYTNQHD